MAGATITPEQAREMQRKSVIARAANAQKFKIADDTEQLHSLIADDFRTQQLLATRAQILKLNRMIAAEIEPQKLDRLFSSLRTAEEIERRLSGRPLPGSLRPKSGRRQASYDEPQPVEEIEQPVALVLAKGIVQVG